jgi:NAD(P)-dependent dehydrogenase (short-subunit alcohol dehydrogenase family)
LSLVVLITGASTGIGHAAALSLARRGHSVIATLRDPARGEALLRHAERERLRLTLAPLDVTDDASVASAIAAALRSHGRIDALVANAGFHQGAAFEETPLAVFRALYETNTLGVVRCAQTLLPHLRARGAGAIVAVTSQSGRFVHATNAAYCASKFAAEAALEALALEVAPFGVRVAIVEPGLTFTAAQQKAVPWPRGTAYQGLYERMGAVFARDAEVGSSAESVGEVVADAVEGSESKLRWPAGRDAARNLAGRARLSDAAWVALHAEPDAARFYAHWREVTRDPDAA